MITDACLLALVLLKAWDCWTVYKLEREKEERWGVRLKWMNTERHKLTDREAA